MLLEKIREDKEYEKKRKGEKNIDEHRGVRIQVILTGSRYSLYKSSFVFVALLAQCFEARRAECSLSSFPLWQISPYFKERNGLQTIVTYLLERHLKGIM